MKKILYTIIILFAGIGLNSCDEDLLDKTPLDEISEPEFWNSANDLQLYVNNLYGEIEGWWERGSGMSPFHDASSDIVILDQTSLAGVENKQMDGTLNVPAAASEEDDWPQYWYWGNIRDVNYFLENAVRVEEGDLVDHYTGEGYFFRAWFYFELFEKFGALPIMTQVIDEDEELDLLYGPRSSRSEVADFILSDLDMAISKMEFASEVGASRLNKDIALLFKARVALYAGTWEKYHQGTAFAGSTDGSGYLQQAAEAAQAVMSNDNYSISMGDGPDEAYYRLFNQVDLSSNPEILFYEQLDYTLGFDNQLDNWPGSMGITHELVQNYLCTDGLPSGLSPLFEEGDDDLLTTVEDNRDPRLAQTIMVPGDVVTIRADGSINYYNFPEFNCPTGYESQKFRRPEYDVRRGGESTEVAFIHFRYAEALLIYAEAKAELGQLTQGDVDMSINLLRDRVGMPHLMLGSITADPNAVDYGYTIPDYLYEIRRERVVELCFEGRRINDLMRWRAHSLFLGKRPSGTFLTPELEAEHPNNFFTNEDGFIDPYQTRLNGPNGGYGFNPDRDYLLAVPSAELILNTNLDQNPGW
jgi:hypothetical protein